MTNKPELTDEKIKRRINAIEERRSASRDFWDGDYEYPEDIELMALRELQELRRSYLALRGEIEGVQAQLYEAETRNEADDTELQERRKADSAEPVSFDELNAAVAEVTGGNQHAWNSGIYKGHQAVPFMNYNSLARIVDKYRAPQPVPVVPLPDVVSVLLNHLEDVLPDDAFNLIDVKAWNAVSMLTCPDACRAAMLQAGNSPVTSYGWIPVSERMPERDVDVQVYCADKKEQMVGYMERNEADGWFRFASLPNGGGVYCKPTHWMPLPAAPQQEVK